MRKWRMVMVAVEPSLDELLEDEMMSAVMRSAHTDRTAVRQLVTDLARRVPAERLKLRCGCRPSCGLPTEAG